MSSQDFDRQFRRTALGMRRRPAPRSWDRIENRLDRRSQGPRIFGIRPWLIAAVLLLIAGVAVLTSLPDRFTGPLAQRAEFMEELDSPVTQTFDRIPDLNPRTEPTPHDHAVQPGESGQLMVSPKYRL